MENNKGQTIFLSVVGVATLLVAIVGATFAYFSINVTGNDNASSIIVQTITLSGVTFTDGDEISMTNAYPGQSISKTFTVATDAATDANIGYDIYLNVTTNTFDNTHGREWLVNTLTGTSSNSTLLSGEVVAALSETTIYSTGTAGDTGDKVMASGAFPVSSTATTHTFTYTLTFAENHSNQNVAQGQSFGAKLHVEITGGSNYTAYGSQYVAP